MRPRTRPPLLTYLLTDCDLPPEKQGEQKER